MKMALILAAALVVAPPAAATRVIALAPADAPPACPAGAANCLPLAEQPTDVGMASPGPIIAGLAGLLVLGLVFGRRRSSLPEVLS